MIESNRFRFYKKKSFIFRLKYFLHKLNQRVLIDFLFIHEGVFSQSKKCYNYPSIPILSKVKYTGKQRLPHMDLASSLYLFFYHIALHIFSVSLALMMISAVYSSSPFVA